MIETGTGTGTGTGKISKWKRVRLQLEAQGWDKERVRQEIRYMKSGGVPSQGRKVRYGLGPSLGRCSYRINDKDFEALSKLVDNRAVRVDVESEDNAILAQRRLRNIVNNKGVGDDVVLARRGESLYVWSLSSFSFRRGLTPFIQEACNQNVVSYIGIVHRNLNKLKEREEPIPPFQLIPDRINELKREGLEQTLKTNPSVQNIISIDIDKEIEEIIGNIIYTPRIKARQIDMFMEKSGYSKEDREVKIQELGLDLNDLD